MKFKIIALLIFIITACKKNESSVNQLNTTIPSILVYPINKLDTISVINKTTSWYNTTRAFTSLFNVHASNYWGFELLTSGELIPYNTGTTSTYNPTKNYFWNDIGTYLYADFTGDGKKDLWAYYWKNPWPTNAKGLHLFSEYELNSKSYNLQMGLTQVRKCVVSDMDNDKKPDIMLFSHGFDGVPSTGDSLAIFYPKDLKYQFLSQDIGFFHGGATGDVNKDGLIDIIAYAGSSQAGNHHPAFYINKGNRNFQLSNNIFKNFVQDYSFNTVELYDINNDGSLDLFLGTLNVLKIILNENGSFDLSKAIDVPIEPGLGIQDISFFDFDFDGKADIMTMNEWHKNPGFGLRIYLNKGNSFLESTNKYFDIVDGFGNNVWIKWIRLFDIDGDGDIDVVADGLFGDIKDKNIFWKNESGKFKFNKI